MRAVRLVLLPRGALMFYVAVPNLYMYEWRGGGRGRGTRVVSSVWVCMLCVWLLLRARYRQALRISFL